MTKQKYQTRVDMCFGKNWSAASFSILIGAAAITSYLNVNWRVPVCFLFFAAKEAIQYATYIHIDTCNDANRFLTSLSWLHISLQPFFLTLLIQAYSSVPELYTVPLVMCATYAVFNTIRLKEFKGNLIKRCTEVNENDKTKTICKQSTCSINGKYHLAYGFELESADSAWYIPTWFTYMLLTFIPALVLGDWVIPLCNLIVIYIAYYVIDGISYGESAAIWCLNTVWLVPIVYYLESQK